MIMMVLPLVAMLIELAVATDYTIGGPNGWNVGKDLQTWASSQTFSVGDNLVFQYQPTFHDVVEVSKAEFDNCRAVKPLAAYFSGRTIVPLTSPGKRYFICALPGHCNQGMKLEINTIPANHANPIAPQAPPQNLIPTLPSKPITLAPVASSPPSILPSTLPPPAPLPLIPGLVPPVAPISSLIPQGPSSSSSLPLVPAEGPSPLIPAVSPESSFLPLLPGSPSSGFTKTSGSLPSSTTSVTVTPSPPSLDSSATVKCGSVTSLALGFSLALMMVIHVV